MIFTHAQCEICGNISNDRDMVETPMHYKVHPACKNKWLVEQLHNKEVCGYCQGGTDPEVICDTCWNKMDDSISML